MGLKKMNWTPVKLVIALVLAAFLYGFAGHRHERQNVNSVVVQYDDYENLFVTEHQIQQALIPGYTDSLVVAQNTLDITQLERELRDHDLLQDAEVHLSLDGNLHARVLMRRPLARMATGSNSYVDDRGEFMPRSYVSSARVPLISGLTDDNVADYMPLLHYVHNDTDLKRLVTSYKVASDGQVSLRLRQENFAVLLGEPTALKSKFMNLKAFLTKVHTDNTNTKYNTIDLRFAGQVVASKNE